jgi:hypothetical protein
MDCQRQCIKLVCFDHVAQAPTYTVRKMDLILRSIQGRPQMQFSMVRKFKLQLLRRYSVKFSKMRNFTLGSPWICSLRLYPCATITYDMLAIFLNNINIFRYILSDHVKFRYNEYKMAENELSHIRLKLFIDRV